MPAGRVRVGLKSGLKEKTEPRGPLAGVNVDLVLNLQQNLKVPVTLEGLAASYGVDYEHPVELGHETNEIGVGTKGQKRPKRTWRFFEALRHISRKLGELYRRREVYLILRGI